MTLFRARRHASLTTEIEASREGKLGRYFQESLSLGNTSSAPNIRTITIEILGGTK
jgi:hypothetical protein